MFGINIMIGLTESQRVNVILQKLLGACFVSGEFVEIIAKSSP